MSALVDGEEDVIWYIDQNEIRLHLLLLFLLLLNTVFVVVVVIVDFADVDDDDDVFVVVVVVVLAAVLSILQAGFLPRPSGTEMCICMYRYKLRD